MNPSLKQALLSQPADQFLDSCFYNDPQVMNWEIQYIFRRSWLYLGNIGDLDSKGNVMVLNIAGLSLLLTRSAEGQLRAFHNICPHRAAAFQDQLGCYHLKHLVCPYHGWVYDLEGKLVGLPRRERFAEPLCLEDYPLRSVRLEQWQDFTFICFDPAVPPLLEFLGEIPTTLAGHCTLTTHLLVKKQYSVRCNWKIYHDNTLCDYHVTVTHRQTLNPVQGPVRFYEHRLGQYINLLYTPTTRQWQQHNRVLESLQGESRQGFFTYGIFPNLHLLALPNGVLAWLRIDPVDMEACTVTLEIYGIPGVSPEEALLVKDFEEFMFEDMQVTEGVQKGYASGFFQPGPVNQLEDRIIHQQQLIRQFLTAGLLSEAA